MIKNILKIIFFYGKLPLFFFQLLVFSKFNIKNLINLKLSPQLFDNKKKEPFDAHYMYHTAWASRVLSKINPTLHHDFASDLRFVTMVSSHIKIIQYNLSIPTVKLDNLEFRTTNLTKMENIKSNSLSSVSCMHVVEHVGLGRYGDDINPEGDKEAIKELVRILAPGANLLFVVPVGKPRIFFNAHRVYSHNDILKSFHSLKLKEFSFIGDNGFYDGIEQSTNINKVEKNEYGCGCYWFKKMID